MLRAQESRNVLSALIGVDRRPTKSIRRTPASCTAVERSCPRPGSVRLLPSSDLENCTRPHPDPAPKPNSPRVRAVEPFELSAASQLTIRVHAAHPSHHPTLRLPPHRPRFLQLTHPPARQSHRQYQIVVLPALRSIFLPAAARRLHPHIPQLPRQRRSLLQPRRDL